MRRPGTKSVGLSPRCGALPRSSRFHNVSAAMAWCTAEPRTRPDPRAREMLRDS